MTSKNKQNAKNTVSKTEYKTSSLKDVLTLQESANELSRLTSQTYTAIDILDLALDGKLQPYIDFKKPTLEMQLKKVDKVYGLLGVPVSDLQALVEPDFAEPQSLTYIKELTGMFIFTGFGATKFGERYFGYAKDYLENLKASIEGKPRPARSSCTTPIFLDACGIFYTLAEKIFEEFYAPHCDIPSTAVLYFKCSEIEKLIRSERPDTTWTKESVLRHLIEHRYNQTAAGKAMGVSRQRVAELMRQHGISNPNSKFPKAVSASHFPTLPPRKGLRQPRCNPHKT